MNTDLYLSPLCVDAIVGQVDGLDAPADRRVEEGNQVPSALLQDVIDRQVKVSHLTLP
jgi:hypothetical protein